MKPNDFDLNTALTLLDSSDRFPVDFDKAWQWLGYNRKDYAKEMLVKNFDQGLDYICEFSGLNRKTPQGGRPSELIMLSLDCFKCFCMMAGTEKGKQVRRYFLECERKLKQLIINDSLPTTNLEQRFTAIEGRLQQLETEVYSKNDSEWKLITPLAAIIRRSQRVGAVTARDIGHSVLFFRNVSANEIRSYFRQLADLGYGTCEGAGTKLRFTAYFE